MKRPGLGNRGPPVEDRNPMKAAARKLSGFSLALLLLFAPLSGKAAAEAINPLSGTAHMFEYGSVEPVLSECGSLCHSFLAMEKAYTEGQMAWVEASGAERSLGVVTALCGTCHRSDGAHGATMSAADSYDNV